jgi:hypothetical protein
VTHAAGGATVATLRDPRSDHDAILRWRASAPASGWVEAGAGGEGFAAVVVEAPRPTGKRAAIRCVLVLQRAATTAGDAEIQARPLVRALLAAMSADDRVAVVGAPVSGWKAPADLARALEGSWEQPGAEAFDLATALRRLPAGGTSVVVVSDGLVADDAAVVAAAGRVGLPVHVVGIGAAPARGLLGQLAASASGTSRFVAPSDDLRALGELAQDLVADLASPPGPLTVNWGQLAARDVEPAALPRLGAGQAALVVARVRRAVAAQGRAHGEVFAIEALAPAARAAGEVTAVGPLGRRWARHRLDALVDGHATADVIARHALAYGLISPETAMVAVGEEVVVRGGVKRTITVPVAVPAGMQWQRVRRAVTVDTTRVADDDGDGNGDVMRDHRAPIERAPADKAPVGKPARGHDGAKVAGDAVTAGATPTLPVTNLNRRPTADAAEAPVEDEARMASPQTATLAAGADNEYDAVSSTSLRGGGRRFAVALGGGVLTGGATDGVLTVAARGEVARIGGLALGARATLWLVGARHPQGVLLGELGVVGPRRWLEAALGVGLHLGDELGPALGLELRAVPGHGPLVPFLRYDGALLSPATGRIVQHGLSLGVEWRW